MAREPGAAGIRAGDARGGLACAVVSLGILLPLGLLAVAPLGTEVAATGVRAAFVAAVVGGLVANAIGGVALPGHIPKTPTTLIYAGLIASLAADPQLRTGAVHDVGAIVTLASLAVALAGALQVALGLLRLGSLVRFVPLPVVAGFMDGVAIMIVLAQVPPLLGIAGLSVPRLLEGTNGTWLPASLALGLATLAVTWGLARRRPRWPAALIGLVTGTVLYAAIAALWPDAALGARLGVPPPGLPLPVALAPLQGDGMYAHLAAHGREVLVAALVLAIIGAMDGLLSAVAIDNVRNTRHHPNRVLIGQGLGSLASAAFGGLPVVYSTAAPLAAMRAGATTRRAGFVSAAVLGLVIAFGGSLLGAIPVAVTAGIMVFVALGLFDQWSRNVWRQWRAGQRDRDTLWSLAVVVVVAGITIAFGFVYSIATGVLLSLLLFIVAMNRSLIRAVATGETRRSRRLYPPAAEAHLREHGRAVRLVEVEGGVFFGTAERLRREVEAAAAGARFAILDVRRVTTIDASGAMALSRLGRELQHAGVRLLLAGIAPGDRHARALRAFGTFAHADDPPRFVDADRALEFAERELLAAADAPPEDREWPVEQLPLFAGLSVAQREAAGARLERRELAAGDVLFREGEPGDCLYVLARGSVSMLAGADGLADAQRRLASFAPGVVFGEAAMLDGGGRTATGVADAASIVHVLTRAALDEVRRDDPALASLLLLNLAREASARLRFATATIRATDQ